MSIQRIVAELVSSGYVASEELVPLSSAEIDKLEIGTGVPLPGKYKEALAVFGRSAGRFLVGSEFFIDGPSTLSSRCHQAKALLTRWEAGFPLPPNAVAFFVHQGYQFLFFVAGTGDDPPVYFCEEGRVQPEMLWATFSDFMNSEIQRSIALWKSTEDLRRQSKGSL